jgi:hypothetical protein
MTLKYLRLALLSEFLVAVIAIFTAWSEIGGQATLDIMPWSWKCGLGLGLAALVVAYTHAILAHESIWNVRSARWFGLILLTFVAMGIVTYFYALQVETAEPDDSEGSSLHSVLIRPDIPTRTIS